MLLYKVAGPIVATPLGYGLFRKELLEPVLYALRLAKAAEDCTGDAHINLLDEFTIMMPLSLDGVLLQALQPISR